MTPKEKAQELLDKMQKQTFTYQEYAGANYTTEEIGWEAGKKCALITVDEMLLEAKGYRYQYLQEVKQEIEKL